MIYNTHFYRQASQSYQLSKTVRFFGPPCSTDNNIARDTEDCHLTKKLSSTGYWRTIVFRGIATFKTYNLMLSYIRHPSSESRISNQVTAAKLRASSCNAEFIESFCTLVSENLCEGPIFYRTWSNRVKIRLCKNVVSYSE